MHFKYKNPNNFKIKQWKKDTPCKQSTEESGCGYINIKQGRLQDSE